MLVDWLVDAGAVRLNTLYAHKFSCPSVREVVGFDGNKSLAKPYVSVLRSISDAAAAKPSPESAMGPPLEKQLETKEKESQVNRAWRYSWTADVPQMVIRPTRSAGIFQWPLLTGVPGTQRGTALCACGLRLQLRIGSPGQSP